MIGIIKHSEQDWDKFYFEMALHVSSMSKDPAKKVGSVAVDSRRRVLSFGYNGFPENVPDSIVSLNDKTIKNKFIVHAEINCIKNAIIPIAGSCVYITRFPCVYCAQALIRHKIARIVSCEYCKLDDSWGASQDAAFDILTDAGIEIHFYKTA